MVGDHLHPAFEAAVYGALLARRADALRAKVRTACLAGDRRLVPPVPGLHPHAAHLLCRAELRTEVDPCPAVVQLILRPLAEAVRGSEIQSRIAVGRFLHTPLVAQEEGGGLST